MSDYDNLISCRDRIHKGLVAKMKHRNSVNLAWIENERQAVAEAANAWALAHPGTRTVTVEDVERIEHLALGHYDYSSKLALYVAEMVVGVRAIPARSER